MQASAPWKEALERNHWVDLYLAGPEYDVFLKQENGRVVAVLKSVGLVD